VTAPTSTLDITLRRGATVVVRVAVERAESLAPATVASILSGTHILWVERRDEKTGKWLYCFMETTPVLTRVPEGTVRVRGHMSGRSCEATSEPFVVVAGGESRVTLTVEPGRKAHVKVVDGRGAPVAGADVWCGTKRWAAERDGVVEVGPVPSGPVRLEVRAKGFRRRSSSSPSTLRR
jgi:hypothetical protein